MKNIVLSIACVISCMGSYLDADTGTVKWFNDQKGFGFITPDNG